MTPKKRGSKKETEELIADARAQGFRVEDRGDKWIVKHPTETDPTRFPAITIHKTPSDHRAVKNMRSMLRKQGFIKK